VANPYNQVRDAATHPSTRRHPFVTARGLDSFRNESMVPQRCAAFEQPARAVGTCGWRGQQASGHSGRWVCWRWPRRRPSPA